MRHWMYYVSKNLTIAIGLVLVWRGVWVLLDLLDARIFGSNHIATAIIGIIIGLACIYLPERSFKNLERL